MPQICAGPSSEDKNLSKKDRGSLIPEEEAERDPYVEGLDEGEEKKRRQ